MMKNGKQGIPKKGHEWNVSTIKAIICKTRELYVQNMFVRERESVSGNEK